MRKKARQQALLDLIARASVSNQFELASLLEIRGFKVTQASISRDLDELGIVKIDGRYKREIKGGDVDLGRVTFDTAGPNIIVGRCSSGLASAITVTIDRAQIPEIVGTIAGDDTILIAVKTSDAQRLVIERLRSQFG